MIFKPAQHFLVRQFTEPSRLFEAFILSSSNPSNWLSDAYFRNILAVLTSHGEIKHTQPLPKKLSWNITKADDKPQSSPPWEKAAMVCQGSDKMNTFGRCRCLFTPGTKNWQQLIGWKVQSRQSRAFVTWWRASAQNRIIRAGES